MGQTRFNAVTRSLTGLPSRRDVLRALAGAGLGLGALLGSAFGTRDVDAKKTHRTKNKKQQPRPVFNQFGCLGVGHPCKGASTLCCSGICTGSAPKQGKSDTRRCAAHGLGTCPQDSPGACTADNPAALKCNNQITCLCLRTTAGSNFCADLNASAMDKCAACTKDADCEALGYPPGSACAAISEGICAGACASGMACLSPCGATP